MIFVADAIGNVVQLMKTGQIGTYSDKIGNNFAPPFFMYGHRREIEKRLQAKSDSPLQSKNKFPLIALNMDISEATRGDMIDFKLNMVFCTYTSTDTNAEEKSNQVIYPTLIPLLIAFKQAFLASGLFVWDGMLDQLFPPHIKIDRPYWATTDANGNLKNIFSEGLSGVELQNLSFSMEDVLQCDGRFHGSSFNQQFN